MAAGGGTRLFHGDLGGTLGGTNSRRAADQNWKEGGWAVAWQQRQAARSFHRRLGGGLAAAASCTDPPQAASRRHLGDSVAWQLVARLEGRQWWHVGSGTVARGELGDGTLGRWLGNSSGTHGRAGTVPSHADGTDEHADGSRKEGQLIGLALQELSASLESQQQCIGQRRKAIVRFGISAGEFPNGRSYSRKETRTASSDGTALWAKQKKETKGLCTWSRTPA